MLVTIATHTHNLILNYFLLVRQDDLSDSIEHIVGAAVEELAEPPNNLHAQLRKTSPYAKKRAGGCPIM